MHFRPISKLAGRCNLFAFLYYICWSHVYVDNFNSKQFFGTNSVFLISTHSVIVYLAVLALDLDFHNVITIMFLGLDVNKFFTVLNLHKSCNKIKINGIFNFLDLLKPCYFILASLIGFLFSSPNSFYSKKVFENLLLVWILVLSFTAIIIVNFLRVYWISFTSD